MQRWDLVWEARSFSVEGAQSPWLVCITYSWHDLFLVREVLKSKPTSAELWNMLLEAIERSGETDTPRLNTLRVAPKQGWEPLKERLKKNRIKLVTTRDLDYPDGFPEWHDSVWQEWDKRKQVHAQNSRRTRRST